jgi:hypothetical protein
MACAKIFGIEILNEGSGVSIAGHECCLHLGDSVKIPCEQVTIVDWNLCFPPRRIDRIRSVLAG